MEGSIQQLTALVTRLEASLDRIEKTLASGGAGAPAASGGAGSEASSASVEEYKQLVATHIKPYVQHSNQLGDLVAQQAALVEKAVEAQVKLLEIASKSKKPTPEVFQKLLAPISALISQISEIREKNRSSKQFNHLSAISEGISFLAWVCVSPTPGPHVNEARGQSEFWSNRILKEYKGKEQLHVDWVTSFNGFLKDLVPYIKKYHTTELAWNPRGEDASKFA
eukprot:TRINITY_DN662_c0_g1_i2.p1 TRINITY_DN662_c0_g1~~TRINITY_DN662_c0_g1_i2.p1  ORF type:complete len:224 (-),score=71.85 TRINITY_DN662_c0_g1_i2:285-956(-)